MFQKTELSDMAIIEELARRGEGHDIMDALRLLTDVYVNNCGISISIRTVAFEAMDAWLNRLAWTDLPLSKMMRHTGSWEMMPLFSSRYNPPECDDSDITPLQYPEMENIFLKQYEDGEFDEPTAEVMAWGLLNSQEKFEPKDIEHTFTINGEQITLKGILAVQEFNCTMIEIQSPVELTCILSWMERDVKHAMEQMYIEYLDFMSKGDYIRALYPRYRRRLEQTERKFEKHGLLEQVYENLLPYKYLNYEPLMRKVLGLAIYSPRHGKVTTD